MGLFDEVLDGFVAKLKRWIWAISLFVVALLCGLATLLWR